MTRSRFGTWALSEQGPTSTLVRARNRSWTVPLPAGSIEDGIQTLRSGYDVETQQAEADVATEAFLAELASAQGRLEEGSRQDSTAILAGVTSRRRERDRILSERYPVAEGPFGTSKPPGAGRQQTDPAPSGADLGDKEMELGDEEEEVPYDDALDPSALAAAADSPQRPFTQDDVQTYYDLLLLRQVDREKAKELIGKRFDLEQNEFIINPVGRVFVPGLSNPPDAQPQMMPGTADYFPEPGQGAAPNVDQDTAPKGNEPDMGNQGDGGSSASATKPAESYEPTVLDDLFLEFATTTDEDVDAFPQWVQEIHPEHADLLVGWNLPTDDAPLTEGQSKRRPKKERTKLTTEQEGRYARWKQLVNMRSREVVSFWRSPELRETLRRNRRTKTESIRLGKHATPWLLRMKETAPEEWTPRMWEWAGRHCHYINRLRNNSAPLHEAGRLTRKYFALRAWGHDPLRAGKITVESLRELRDDRKKLHRYLGSLPGPAPHLIVVEGESKAPALAVLKEKRRSLSDVERQKVIDGKAVWPGSGNPGVWKAVVAGKTWYCSNTHRAYAASPSLDAAIKKFPDIEATS